MNRRQSRRERRQARNEWIATEGRRIQTYHRLMGGTIPDETWRELFGPTYGALTYKRAEALELLVELNILVGRIPFANPAHWESPLYMRRQLEDVHAAKHKKP